MPRDPHTTVRFPKVAPVDAPASPAPPEAGGKASSTPSDAPIWHDDPPTIRQLVGVSVAPAIGPADRAILTVLHGVNAGQVFSLEAGETVIGRARDANIFIDDAGISRRHAQIDRIARGDHVIRDLGSTNGILVNGERTEQAVLHDGDRVQIGPAVILRFGLLAADEAALALQLYEGSTRDALTRLYNRKYAIERLTAEVAYAQRHGTQVSLILFDLDHFKRVNDTFGHTAGDVVLRVVAAQTQKAVRSEDVVARYGGEEFVVIVRGVEHGNALVLADRIRKAVERLVIPWESGPLRASVSVGVSSLSKDEGISTWEALFARADERLYQAKSAGRNRVC